MQKFYFRPSPFFFFLILLLLIPVVVMAQEGEIPEFPGEISIILGAVASVLTGALKKITDDDLGRLLIAGGASAAVAIIAAFVALGAPAGTAEWTLFISAVFAYSQVTWNTFKVIRDKFNSLRTL